MTQPPAYTIRDAEEDDLPGILEIYNEQIASSTAIFIDEPLDLENRRAWMRETKAAGYPIVVAVPSTSRDQDTEGAIATLGPSVLGFAGYGAFATKSGYRYTVETTLYVHESARGRGIGDALQRTLIDHAKTKRNVHVIVAVITADNLGSIRFHERFGFVQMGVLREVGYKFGRWRDVTFMQLVLPDGGPSETQ